MRKSLIVVFALAVSASAFAVTPQQQTTHRVSTAFTPPNAELDTYPFEKKPTTHKETVELMDRMWKRGLTLRALQYPWIGYNYHAEVEGGRWILETLPAGTYVWVDREGNQLYKFDCVNRLVWTGGLSGPCPKCSSGVRNPSGSAVGNQSPAPSGKGMLERIGDALKHRAARVWAPIRRFLAGAASVVGNVLRALWWLLLLLLPFLLLVALGWLLSELWRHRNGGGGGTAPAGPGAPPTPVAGGAAGAAAAPAVVAAPVVVPPPADGAQADADRPLSIERNDDGSHTIDLDGFRRVTATRRDGRVTFQIFQ